jgi:hypothetical protein
MLPQIYLLCETLFDFYPYGKKTINLGPYDRQVSDKLLVPVVTWFLRQIEIFSQAIIFCFEKNNYFTFSLFWKKLYFSDKKN